MYSNRISRVPRGLLLASALGLAGPALFGQTAPIVRTGNTEIGGFAGATVGIDKVRVMGGGNVAYAAHRVVMPYAEFSYFPGIGRNDKVTSGQFSSSYSYSVALVDFHGGVHLRMPVSNSKVVPYAVIGAGMIHSMKSSSNRIEVRDSTGRVIFSDTVTAPARTDFAVNFGGGIRYYVNEKFGFRVEAKAYKPSGTFTAVFGKVEGGVFLQLK